MSYTVSALKEKMSTGHIWEVVFTKKNGQPRTMNASRDWDFLKENADALGFEIPTCRAAYEADDYGVVRVWDCDEQDWRCIYAEGVLSIVDIDKLEATCN